MRNWFCITTTLDWLKILEPLFDPIRSKVTLKFTLTAKPKAKSLKQSINQFIAVKACSKPFYRDEF